ncbi:helix-turn-helix transcriptional regulator [Kineosporia sp. J2-2]|uniref:Helix-turn-helix transcriptional regulator n=1 Tax=Kineosporia corallincola TaxID=2835133 RepID=A0ABS5TIG2_9ACTN|nr:helix-turn-helix transcriptional regulator [Kineosporia corallincola]MBT0770887.1 helix-turn-helix transcriptional regulator [Kineosporia corallincola]
MTTAPPARDAGAMLRWWRERRHLTQLELSGLGEVSTRHLSYVETGRSKPSSRLILRLCEHLGVPLRRRNEILLAAGFAPAYPEHRLLDPPLAAVNSALTAILAAHEPLPAVAVDRHWEMIAATSAITVLTEGCAPELLEPPVNVLRLSLHPRGIAPRITNLGDWRAHLLHRLEAQVRAGGDPVLADLLTELRELPGPQEAADPVPEVLVPLRLRLGGTELSLLSTTTVFGTPAEITVSELAIEAFYPADAATAAALGLNGNRFQPVSPPVSPPRNART